MKMSEQTFRQPQVWTAVQTVLRLNGRSDMISSERYIIYNSAQGVLAHRLQRRPRPIHNNAKSTANPSSPPLGFNVAGGVGGGVVKKILSKPNATQLNSTLKQLALELDIVVTCSTHPPHPTTHKLFTHF